MSNRETHDLLRRILGDGTDALLTQANGKDPDAAALNAAGIDPDTMLTQAKKQIDDMNLHNKTRRIQLE